MLPVKKNDRYNMTPNQYVRIDWLFPIICLKCEPRLFEIAQSILRCYFQNVTNIVALTLEQMRNGVVQCERRFYYRNPVEEPTSHKG